MLKKLFLLIVLIIQLFGINTTSVEWTKVGGASSYDTGYGITTDINGNIFVTGLSYYSNLDGLTTYSYSDIFITKYSNNGTKLWTKLLGGSSDDRGQGIITDINGNVFVTGFTYSNLDGNTNSGNSDIFITKYSNNGTKLWTKLLGGSSDDRGHGITINENENISITGYSKSNLNKNIKSFNYDIFVIKLKKTSLSELTSTTSLYLNKGWNLVSLPTNKSISQTEFKSIFKNSSNIWKFSKGVWSHYLNNISAQKQTTNNKFNLIQSLNKEEGFWIYNNISQNIRFSGKPYKLYLNNLSNGWNLVGTGKDINTSEIYKLNNKITFIWIYKNNSWFVSSNNNKIIKNFIDNGFNSFSTIKQGRGIWILKKGINKSYSKS